MAPHDLDSEQAGLERIERAVDVHIIWVSTDQLLLPLLQLHFVLLSYRHELRTATGEAELLTRAGVRGQFRVGGLWDTVGVEAPLVRQKLYLADRRIKNVLLLIVVSGHSNCKIEAVLGAERVVPCVVHLLIDRR